MASKPVARNTEHVANNNCDGASSCEYDWAILRKVTCTSTRLRPFADICAGSFSWDGAPMRGCCTCCAVLAWIAEDKLILPPCLRRLWACCCMRVLDVLHGSLFIISDCFSQWLFERYLQPPRYHYAFDSIVILRGFVPVYIEVSIMPHGVRKIWMRL